MQVTRIKTKIDGLLDCIEEYAKDSESEIEKLKNKIYELELIIEHLEGTIKLLILKKMPNLVFFPTEIQDYIKDFEFNAPELGLTFIKSTIVDETRHGNVYEYIFKYKDVYYRLTRSTEEDSGLTFEEQCWNCGNDNMFKIVKPKEVTVIVYE